MTSPFKYETYDAVIVGGRVAGAATGMLLARSGARVLIVERAREIGDTLSTHALMPPAVAMLEAWGILGEATADTPEVRRVEFSYGAEQVVVPIPAERPGLFAPRRWRLDPAIGRAAVASGAEFVTGVACRGLLRNSQDRVVGIELLDRDGGLHRVSADLVIGADGLNSTVARLAGARKRATSTAASAAVYGYVEGLPDVGYQWLFGDRVSGGLIPTTGGVHLAFAACRPAELRARFGRDPLTGMAEILAAWHPDAARHIRQTGSIERLRRFAGAPAYIRACAGPGWALVGDAGYFKDPISAHGLTDAFLDAQRLASAIIDGADLATYQRARDAQAFPMFALTQRMAAMDWSLEELKALHLDINACMKAELSTVRGEEGAVVPA